MGCQEFRGKYMENIDIEGNKLPFRSDEIVLQQTVSMAP